MSFSESVQQETRRRSRGICQCARQTCSHSGPCKAKGAEYHHKKTIAGDANDDAANCQFLCQRCHQQAHGAGGSLGRL
ncbi:MAG: HNH endonuclease signature motif containing protein [Acidimicrobiales bacterium]|jgi:5-methylcytosine-specific restriction endonuclease McrA